MKMGLRLRLKLWNKAGDKVGGMSGVGLCSASRHKLCMSGTLSLVKVCGNIVGCGNNYIGCLYQVCNGQLNEVSEIALAT